MYTVCTANNFDSCKLLAMPAKTYTLHRALKYYKSNINKLVRPSPLSKTLGPKNGPVKPLGLTENMASGLY